MPILLEAFDAPLAPPPDAAPAGPSPDWIEGHAVGFEEGLAQGTAEAEARATHLSQELAQNLQDMTFGYAEAREQVLLSLRPLFRLLTQRLLPRMVADGLGAWITEALLDAARADTGQPLVVELHPDRIEAVRACLPPGHPAVLRENPELGPGMARLLRADRESELDLDACLATLTDALSALHDDTALKVCHG
jgi:flagellar assembly protein FliH